MACSRTNSRSIYQSTIFVFIRIQILIGVEIGGALKNIIALAAGITDGLGYGDNAKAALMTRGISRNFYGLGSKWVQCL